DILNSSNTWIADNSALVLARVSVEKIGCKTILTHKRVRFILKRLVDALKIDNQDRSTNAAFTIAASMLTSSDNVELHKNACYALSCICNSEYGIEVVIQSNVETILEAIENIITSDDRETVWFAVTYLRILAGFEETAQRLQRSKELKSKLKNAQEKWLKCQDIQNELRLIWHTLQKNLKPSPPIVISSNSHDIEVSWELCADILDFDVQFRLLLGETSPDRPTFPVIGRREIIVKWQLPDVLAGKFTHCELISNGKTVYSGTELEYHLTMLKPDSEYMIEIIVFTNEGKFRSKPTKVRTQNDDYSGRQAFDEDFVPQSNNFKIVPLLNLRSPPLGRRLSREFKDIRNVQMTTVHALQSRHNNNSLNKHISPSLTAFNLRNNENTGFCSHGKRTDVHSSGRTKTNGVVNNSTTTTSSEMVHNNALDYKISVITPCFETDQSSSILNGSDSTKVATSDHNHQITRYLPINRVVNVQKPSTPSSFIKPIPSALVTNVDTISATNMRRKMPISMTGLVSEQRKRSMTH
ncbi:unnamed protein product, partial [Didymodactylos carnosus]